MRTRSGSASQTGGYEANVRRYFVFQALINFWLWMPIWVIYLQSRGLTLAQVGVADAVSLVLLALAEVPTGAIADRYGRRVSLALGALLIGIGSLIIGLSDRFSLILLAYVPKMIGSTLLSGADEALLYDSLRAAGRGEDFTRANGRALMIIQGAWGGASLLGGVLAGVTALYVPYFVYAGLSALAVGVALALKEPPRTEDRPAAARLTYGQILREAFTLALTRPLVRRVMLYRAAINTAPFILTFLLLQPYARSVGIPVVGLGIVVLAGRLAGMLGAYLGGRAKELNVVPILSITSGAVLTALLALIFVDSWTGLVLIVLISMLAWIQRPVLSTILNRAVSSEIRATLLSIQSLVYTVVLFVADPTVGFIADRWGFPIAFAALAMLLAVSAGPLLLSWRSLEAAPAAPPTEVAAES